MKFSITIPAYKQRYLKEAIESCLAQTYQDFEVVIVDDASPEDLKSVMNQFVDDRIRYYRNEKNCGAMNVVDNWNICLSYAKGDYVICMGDDDRLLPNCLAEYAKLADKYPGLNVYHGMTEIIDEESSVYDIQEARPEREGVCSMISGRLRNHRLQYIGDWLFSRERLLKAGGFVKLPMAWGSDDLSAFMMAQERGVANTQVPVFQYRVNSQTISNSGHFREKAKTQMIVFDRLEEIIKREMLYNDEKEETFRISVQRKISLYRLLSVQNYIKSDMRAAGSLGTLGWWLKNASDYGISKSDVIKAMVKSLRI